VLPYAMVPEITINVGNFDLTSVIDCYVPVIKAARDDGLMLRF